jgi:catechol 2,3-dioxygenase-like lactoylglutathione lyase family enzyme
MAKLRHITLAVDDMEKTATFYEQAFEMKRVRQSGVAIMMSDGVVSLAIIDANKNANSGARKGLHHIGFLVDNIDEAAAKVEQGGGKYAGQIKEIGGGPKSERKYTDPDGVPFDVATPEHARKVWCIPA